MHRDTTGINLATIKFIFNQTRNITILWSK